jgi:hypothetical protein
MPKSKTKKETRKVRTQKNKKVSTKTTTEPPATNDRQTEHPYTESYMSSSRSSSYASNMLFDGNKMTIDTQINGQPVEHKEYTLRDIRKNNPLGAELIKQYLKNKVPRTLKRPPVNTQIYIRPVLSSFSDLGLNNNNNNNQIDHDHDDQDQKDIIYKILPTDENIRLRISDIDSDPNNSHLINELPMHNAKPKPKPNTSRKNKSVKKNKNKNKNE